MLDLRILHRAGVRHSTGFTIVELLIVIVVTGVLTTIVVVAYNGVTNGTKDARRSADLNNIAKVLERYRIDNGGYPRCGATGPNTSPYALSANTAQSCLADELVPYYMASIPTDPVNSGSHVYRYAAGYRKTGTITYTGTPATDDYILGVRQEATTSPTYSGWGFSDLTLLLGSSN
jgi:prepilin-type N-terminal cleavage/methylation domain-containing protein